MLQAAHAFQGNRSFANLNLTQPMAFLGKFEPKVDLSRERNKTRIGAINTIVTLETEFREWIQEHSGLQILNCDVEARSPWDTTDYSSETYGWHQDYSTHEIVEFLWSNGAPTEVRLAYSRWRLDLPTDVDHNLTAKAGPNEVIFLNNLLTFHRAPQSNFEDNRWMIRASVGELRIADLVNKQ